MDKINDNCRLYDKIQGCLIGGAAGDALGAPVEFLQDFLIFKNYGEDGITELRLYDTSSGKKALVSDDTQMTLFTLDGIVNAIKKHKNPDKSQYIRSIYESYLSWLTTQEDFKLPDEVMPSPLLTFKELHDRRAPGNTCLSALRYGNMGSIEFKINNSKGCGGVMRVAPIGVLAIRESFDIATIGMLGAEVSALTHGHELGYTPSAFLAMMVACILKGNSLKNSVLYAKRTLLQIFPWTEHMDRLIGLIDKAIDFACSEEEVDDLDAIRNFGEGWVAEETLAIAVYCSLRYVDNFEKALIASVNHSGDSDSTGAVTGNILGAYLGYNRIPDKFKRDIDVEPVINYLCDEFYNVNN